MQEASTCVRQLTARDKQCTCMYICVLYVYMCVWNVALNSCASHFAHFCTVSGLVTSYDIIWHQMTSQVVLVYSVVRCCYYHICTCIQLTKSLFVWFHYSYCRDRIFSREIWSGLLAEAGSGSLENIPSIGYRELGEPL